MTVADPLEHAGALPPFLCDPVGNRVEAANLHVGYIGKPDNKAWFKRVNGSG